MTAEFAKIDADIRKAVASQGFMKFVGAAIESLAPGEASIVLDRRDEVLQHNGFFHGGVIAFLIDNTSTIAAGTMFDRSRMTLTAEYKLNFLAPASGDRLICRAKVLKPGRTLTVVEAKVHCVTDGQEKLVAAALATIASAERPKAA
jgi:uncharacterized protein (TIGR00369 family)